MEVPKLHLEEALADNPQMHSLLQVFNEDTSKFVEYTKSLWSAYQYIYECQYRLNEAMQNLSMVVAAFPMMGSEFTVANDQTTSTLQQYAAYLNELNSNQQVLLTQLCDSVMFPLRNFVETDYQDMKKLQHMHNFTRDEHLVALDKYMKLARKCNEKQRAEAVDDVYQMRRKYHQVSLRYYAALNSLQLKRRFVLMESVQAHLQAFGANSKMEHETFNNKQINEFLSRVSDVICQLQSDLQKDVIDNQELAVDLEQGCLHGAYLPESMEPGAGSPQHLRPTESTQRNGYIYLRRKLSVLSVKWERVYCYTQAGNLMCQLPGELAGQLLLDLNQEGVRAEVFESDDRRHVFRVLSPSDKMEVVMQCESEEDRNEWIGVVHNVITRSGYVKRQASTDSEKHAQAQKQVDAVAKQLSRTGVEFEFPEDTPIQFDLPCPQAPDSSPESPEQPSSAEVERSNPFGEGEEAGAAAAAKAAASGGLPPAAQNAAFSQVYTVRFQGSMEVPGDRGEWLINETMRRILGARAEHNVFRMTEVTLVVTNEGIWLMEPSSKHTRLSLALEDVAYWATHKENVRLFGFISRQRSIHLSGKSTFTCHIFEADMNAEEICNSIGTATKIAYQSILERRAAPRGDVVSEETNLIMQNISRLPDMSSRTGSSPSPETDEQDISPEAEKWLQNN